MIAANFSIIYSEGSGVIVEISRKVLGGFCHSGEVLELTECHRKRRRHRVRKRSKRRRKKLLR